MQPLLTIQNLSAGYGGKTVIRDISLTLMPGEILGVVGESGSGKTTLLKAVSEVKGLRTDVYTGTVTFDGEDLLHMDAEEKKKMPGRRDSLCISASRRFPEPYTESACPVL